MTKRKQILLSENEIKLAKEANEENHFPMVKFNFVRDHMGFRPGCIHTMMSTSSAGKSTLVRSLLRQVFPYNKMTYYSTEESLNDAKLFFSQGYTNVRKLAENVAFMHEDDFLGEIAPDDYSQWINELFADAISFGSDMIVIDNISTSDYYDGKLKSQSAIVNMIGRLARASGIAVFIVIHTATGVTQDSGKLLTPDDVRGGRTISNKSEYFYTLQRFTSSGGDNLPVIDSFITIHKARKHNVSNQIYQLRYSDSANQFTSDRKVDFEEFKKAFLNRNTLTATKGKKK